MVASWTEAPRPEKARGEKGEEAVAKKGAGQATQRQETSAQRNAPCPTLFWRVMLVERGTPLTASSFSLPAYCVS